MLKWPRLVLQYWDVGPWPLLNTLATPVPRDLEDGDDEADQEGAGKDDDIDPFSDSDD